MPRYKLVIEYDGGPFCGWLCPFGALQELTNTAAKWLKVPQVTVPWGLHERLWPVKYMIFLGLFGLSLYSLARAEVYAEVEPFKTAIILNFMREWWFVLFALLCLLPTLVIERFYCRYLCPLGAGLAIPARIRMFDWLKRYRECGNPCQTCGVECMVQAIHPTGQINPNECLNCMHCQVLYHSKEKCPVVQRTLKRRETASASAASIEWPRSRSIGSWSDTVFPRSMVPAVAIAPPACSRSVSPRSAAAARRHETRAPAWRRNGAPTGSSRRCRTHRGSR